MQVQAKAKFIRRSPRKVRLILDLIRGLSIAEAREQLAFLPKAAARVVLKVLDSTSANAKHNLRLQSDDLFVSKAFVDQGPTVKRFRARAFGRAATIRKRTSHITIVLAEKEKIQDKNKIQ